MASNTWRANAPLTLQKHLRSDFLMFQVVDWSGYDVIDEDAQQPDQVANVDDDDDEEGGGFRRPARKHMKFEMKAYGVTEDGVSVCAIIREFMPHFFVKLPADWTTANFNAWTRALNQRVGAHMEAELVDIRKVERKEFYGFQNNELFSFARIVVKSQQAFNSYKSTLTRPLKVGSKMYNFKDSLYETNILPLLRFFHIQNIEPSSWIRIPRDKYRSNAVANSKKTRCQIEVETNWDCIGPVEKNGVAPFLVANFDIECTSADGSFPKAERPGDQVIQIGTTVHRYGQTECFLKHIVTLRQSAAIEEEGTIVESYDTEREVILAWAKFIERLDPDFLCGYNIWGFDMKYLYERAKMGNGGVVADYSRPLLQKLNRLKNKPAEYMERKLSSSALGDNLLYMIEIEGTVGIDLYKLIQRDYKLDSYKLDNVAKEFLKKQKVDLSPKQIFTNFQNGSPEKIREIAVYCLMDCELCNKLMIKLETIANNMGMSNVCCVPLTFLFVRGQGIKIFSLVAKKCREENFVVKAINKDDQDESSYEGAIVFVPTPGIYFEPISVMDYSSLYPSSMIAENISHDSIVTHRQYDLEGNLVSEWGRLDLEDLPEYNYNVIEYDTFEGMGDDKKVTGKKVCKYVESKNGEKNVLPRILQHLLKARKTTRKKATYQTVTCINGEEWIGVVEESADEYVIATEKHGEKRVAKSAVVKVEDTYNDFMKKLLDGLQQAYKVTCNSLYGQVGAATSSICFKELAASTTATGRRMVTTARDIVLSEFPGSKVVYGDTDSIFVNFKGYIDREFNPTGEQQFGDMDYLRLSIESGKRASRAVSSKIKKPHDLAYEKTFWPFCIFSKKRYFGNKYEEDVTKYKQTSMGIVLKRRDNAPIVKDIYGGVIDIILNQKNIEKSKQFFRDAVRRLFSGQCDIKSLIISKSLRGDYANPTSIPHKALADRMAERDSGNKLSSSDRVPYCYIHESNLKCVVCAKKVNINKCKCVTCMKLYCVQHLGNHRDTCTQICRFCKVHNNEEGTLIRRCETCNGCYCGDDFAKHMLKKDKYGNESHDKCKKPLSNKIIQGDIVENPLYILENDLKIDYRYYYDHQIEKPVMQIFELVMKNPASIVEDILRDDTNKKTGNQDISKWFKLGGAVAATPAPATAAKKKKKIELSLEDLEAADSDEDILGGEKEDDGEMGIEVDD
jgi:DNA polymerase delta subunit 1